MLNAGVIGMGIGEKHAIAYQNHCNTNLTTICDFDNNKSKELNTKFPNVSIENKCQAILENEDINIVSIASYDNFHVSQIIKALESGKHVMSEKPLCLNRSEMLQIYRIHQQNPDSKISSNLVLRTNSRFKKLKKDINEGKFGDVYYLEGDYLWGRKSKLFEWRADMDYYSIILGAAIHMIDLVMWLIDSRPISVQAIGNDIASKNTNLEFNSFAVVILKFENGIIAKLTGNGGCVHPHFHGLKIFGTKQTAISNLNEAYFLQSSEMNSKQMTIAEPYPEKEAREKIIHSFVDFILDPSRKPLVSHQDVYDVMTVCFAAEEAMNTGKSIIIEYLD
jgi:predicted dehydrogenase